MLSKTAAGITACHKCSTVLMQASAVHKTIDEDIARHMAATSWEMAQVPAHSKQMRLCMSMACSILGSALLLAVSLCTSLTIQMRARHCEGYSVGCRPAIAPS